MPPSAASMKFTPQAQPAKPVKRGATAVPDCVRDLRNAARPSLPVNLDEFHPRHTRTGDENMKNEPEADGRQLVWIADQQQSGAGRQSADKAVR